MQSKKQSRNQIIHQSFKIFNLFLSGGKIYAKTNLFWNKTFVLDPSCTLPSRVSKRRGRAWCCGRRAGCSASSRCSWDSWASHCPGWRCCRRPGPACAPGHPQTPSGAQRCWRRAPLSCCLPSYRQAPSECCIHSELQGKNVGYRILNCNLLSKNTLIEIQILKTHFLFLKNIILNKWGL